MKLIKNVALFFIATLSLASCEAKIKNAKTETIKVYGNCEMCKERIEAAIYKKGISEGVWNVDSKMLSFTYNSEKTTGDEVLKQLAYAGHDNKKFLAPDDSYSNLPECCQYNRKKTDTVTRIVETKTEVVIADTSKKTIGNINPLSEVYAAYFALKDALAKDDGTTASSKAKELFKAIEKADMTKMSPAQHTVWMKYQEKLSYDTDHIKNVEETEHQREHFIYLSKNMYEVMKVFKMDVPVYYEYCPMANNGKGANWLSLDEKISNPYLGKQMPTCGKVQETIK